MKQFGLDWRLLVAQAVNFFILFLILKKFAYRPILEMLKKRKERIEAGLFFTKEAEERLARVEELSEQKLEEARKKAFEVVKEGEQIARVRKEEVIKEAMDKAEAVVEEAQRAIVQDKAKIEEEVYEEAQELIREGIVKVLRKMPAEARDHVLIEEALRELRAVSHSK